MKKERKDRNPKRKRHSVPCESRKRSKTEVENILTIEQLNVGRLTNTKHTFLEEAANKQSLDKLCLQEVKRRTDPEDGDMPIDGYDGPHRCPCTREKAQVNKVSTCLGLAIYFRRTSTLPHGNVVSDTTPEGVSKRQLIQEWDQTAKHFQRLQIPKPTILRFPTARCHHPIWQLDVSWRLQRQSIVAGVQETATHCPSWT